MGILYLEPEDVTVFVDIKEIDGNVELEFTADCGKYGTIEAVSGFKLTPRRLKDILESNDDYTDEELNLSNQAPAASAAGGIK